MTCKYKAKWRFSSVEKASRPSWYYEKRSRTSFKVLLVINFQLIYTVPRVITIMNSINVKEELDRKCCFHRYTRQWNWKLINDDFALLYISEKSAFMYRLFTENATKDSISVYVQTVYLKWDKNLVI